MAGTLISNGYKSLHVDAYPKEFLRSMADFYDSADATKIIALFNAMAKEQYPDFLPSDERHFKNDGI